MTNLILEYSKYLMLLIWLVFLLQFLGYGIIYLMTRDRKMLVFYGI